ncbi:putative baseplate assembly protein [Methanolobus sp. ZRKC3]|uniref:putative baseplate assembly protein n=1 Tax=Methanolobus sp. ZRKC3 TaxID=3125786 RepID=UPI00324A7721
MSLPKPDLDNKTFDQLVDEARKLIPNYATQWTDHNLSDPGITLIDLFAWLTEITLYRINLVNEEHRLKYLKLLGVKPATSIPAKVDLSFGAGESTLLKKNTVVSTKKDGMDINFELDEDVNVVPLTLKKIIVNELNAALFSTPFAGEEFMSGVFDRTIANQKDDLFFTPFGQTTQEGSCLYLGFGLKEEDEGRKQESKAPHILNFMCYLYEKDLISPGRHGDEEDYEFENAKLKWEISVAPDAAKWKEVFPDDGTKDFKQSGRLLFEGLESWELSRIPIWKSDSKYFWMRCTLERSDYEYPPRIERIMLNTVEAVQRKTVHIITLGISNGLPNQVFALQEVPVLNKSLKLWVAGEKWTEVDDLDGSGPEDTHFILDNENGEIRFGDGLMGKVPSVDSGIRIPEYMAGGGEQGNLMPDCTWSIQDVEDMDITNQRASTGGKEAETIAEATDRFIRDLKVPYTAVTSEDFEYIAKNTPGLRVATAKSIPNHDPMNPEKGEGSVTVVVIPFSPLKTFAIPPEPSSGFKNAIKQHLNTHRLLGTRIHVIPPVYIRTTVNVTVVPSNGFLKEGLAQKIIDRLNFFLHPVKGGREGNGWPIGRSLYRSELYELIKKIDGVDSITELSIRADKNTHTDEYGNLVLDSRIATIYSGRHVVEMINKADAGRRGSIYAER